MAQSTGYSNAEVKAGVFLTVCILLFISMLFVYGRVARVWRGRQEISVLFTSISSLRQDAPVRYNGVDVGRVKDIRIVHLDDANIRQLPPIRLADIDNLPLTEKERKDLKIEPGERLRNGAVKLLQARVDAIAALIAFGPAELAGQPFPLLDRQELLKLAPEALKENVERKINDRIAELKKIIYLKEEDLASLPLTDAEKTKLREEATEKFAVKVEELLKNRTMIKLTLEVLHEGDAKRYRADDQVRISTTLMGDTSVEIASGSGEALAKNEARFMLGHSGDFFSNLARSVEQVKEILGSVSDVVGPKERESVQNALLRFDKITTRIESIVTVADTRLKPTWDKVDDLAINAKSNFTRIGDTVVSVQPQVTATLKTADDALKDLQDRSGKLMDEARNAVVEVKGDIKPIFSDLKHMTSQTKDDFPLMIRNAKDLATRLQTSAGKLDAVLSTGDRLLLESYPDLRRLVLAFRMGAENFEEATSLLKRKPWLIYNVGKEDAAYNNAQKSARDLELATRRFAELGTELQALRRTMDGAPKERLERIDYLLQELGILSEMLKFAGDASKKEILPPFERKAGGFVPVLEEFDPNLKKKPKDENL